MTDRPPRHVHDRLHDILCAVQRIKLAERELKASAPPGVPLDENLAFQAVLYNLVVISEAVNSLPQEITDAKPALPWRDIVDIRNFLSHEYFRISVEIVRQSIDAPLEQLRQACQELLDAQGHAGD